MNFKNIKYSFFPSFDEKDEFFGYVNSNNISKFKIIYPVGILIPILFLFINNLNEFNNNINEIIWKNSLLTIHYTMLIFFCILGIISLLYHKNIILKLPQSKISIIADITYLFVLVSGILISVVDQYITTSIAPFIIVCAILPMVFIIYPMRVILYLTIGLIVYTIMMVTVITNPSILISNLVNGITALIISLVISLLFWKSRLYEFRQNRTIVNQKEELIIQNDKLRIVADELQYSNMTKDKFFAIIAHDLRSPLYGLKNLSQLIFKDFLFLSDEEKIEMLDLLSQSSKNVSTLLENLLSWASSQQGKILINPTKIKLSKIIEEQFELQSINAAGKNIDLRNEIDDDVEISADLDIIKTVLRNLISNAVKFTPNGGSVTVKNNTSNNFFNIEVIDTGIGLSAKKLDSIFKIDQNQNTRGTNDEKGTGLGLILCKELIEKHNGIISAKNNKTIGSTFTVSLPLEINL